MYLPASLRFVLLLVCLSALLHKCPSALAEECPQMSSRLRAFKLVMDCNSTTLKEKQRKEIQSPTVVLFIPILYLVALLIGLPANLLALWVLLFRTKKLPSTTLLINLTFTDLMLLLVLPFRIVYHFRGNDWAFGEPFCRVVTALFYGNIYGSVLCLALVAVDRYIALVHPFGAKTLRSRRASTYVSLAVWVVVLAAMLPLLISKQSYQLTDLNITTCHDALPEKFHDNYFLPYFTTLFTVCFLLPFLIILYCYGAVIRTLMAGGKRYTHAVRVTVLVLVVFLVCLLPSNVLLLLHYSGSKLIKDPEDLYIPYLVSLAFSTFNSCIDPFIFYYVSEDFREKVAKVLCCRGGESDSSSGNQSSNTSSSGKTRSKFTLLSKSSRGVTSSSEEEKL